MEIAVGVFPRREMRITVGSDRMAPIAPAGSASEAVGFATTDVVPGPAGSGVAGVRSPVGLCEGRVPATALA